MTINYLRMTRRELAAMIETLNMDIDTKDKKIQELTERLETKMRAEEEEAPESDTLTQIAKLTAVPDETPLFNVESTALQEALSRRDVELAESERTAYELRARISSLEQQLETARSQQTAGSMEVELAKNIVLNFLLHPEQRAELLPLLSSTLHLTAAEEASLRPQGGLIKSLFK